MLQVKGAEISYGKVRAVQGADLEVRAGEVVSLIGLNGAGKSSLLRAIAGLTRMQAGTVMFKGEAVQNLPGPEVARRGIALVLEGRSTFKHMTVQENLVLGGYMRKDREAIQADLERMLERFPVLRPRLKQPAGTLSGGEQQMLVIARALLARPSLLMLDEPSLGLAPLVVADIFRLIHELNQQGSTILLVEQNAHQALKISHRGYVMETGRIVLEGAHLADDPRVRQAYLGV
ncbi:ABC transporter ATP-binding protein [Ramlibacter henchirensis]|uniref:ABC transporter ATP-binding protein n=1 Tax=Ramlibacter henchirensis TaxID=204072 RepID=A0A4Z0BTL9_9BURK|nr:ABC transporter ATP-binding protein [Ramlibacter henchirensis]TFZ02623.1 ABC transporter ATP-binding protein [Ramlibacter henchirensis]